MATFNIIQEHKFLLLSYEIQWQDPIYGHDQRYMNDQSLGWSWWEESGVEKWIFLEEEKSKENFKYFFFFWGISFYLSILKFLLEKSFLMARTKCWRCYHTQQKSEEWSKVTLYIDLHTQLHGDHIPEIILN